MIEQIVTLNGNTGVGIVVLGWWWWWWWDANRNQALRAPILPQVHCERANKPPLNRSFNYNHIML